VQYNKYKQHYINDKVPDGTSSTVYRCGPLIDLCLGPHVPHTGRIKALAVTKVSQLALEPLYQASQSSVSKGTRTDEVLLRTPPHTSLATQKTIPSSGSTACLFPIRSS
jgi:hypothetical protein